MKINRSIFKSTVNKSREMKSGDNSANVYLYDEIGFFGITAAEFVPAFDKITNSEINVYVNSPGGLITDGVAIYNAIKRHKSDVTVTIDGLAASITSIIIMAADKILMHENAWIVLHDPLSGVVGNSADMRHEAGVLDETADLLIKTYSDRTGIDGSKFVDMMSVETWISAKEALEMGIIDEIIENKKSQKMNQTANLFNLSVFSNVPDKLKDEKREPTARDLECILRDAGCSANRAKEILAKGFVEDDQRDVENLDQRDVETTKPLAKVDTDQRDVEKVEDKKKDRVSDLLERAEKVAPSTN